MPAQELKYFCPQCRYERSFRDLDEFRANPFCPKDGTMLRPAGWEAKPAARKEPEPPAVAKPAAIRSVPAKKVKLGRISPGQTGLLVEGVVVSKRAGRRSAWREHAVAMITDGSATLPLNLWRDQVAAVHVGDRIRLRDAFARSRGKVVELSTWEERIEVLRRKRAA